ncbi:oligosaccharide flippase family protein [Longitalea luteola]|uniref:oligosaccharide flippase family protein n=1 Tax=Longitalea luteola TaxID=2812563 RepID=UPI001A95F8F6|nr:oligosaccharide flippase family protein [Longitalea luteola]
MEGSSRRSQLFSNFLALGILQGTNLLLPLLVMPFAIEKIGLDGYGVVAVAQVVMLIFCTITDYGFNLTATRALALHREDVVKNARLFFTVLAAKMFICLLLLGVLVVLITLVPFFRPHAQLYLFAFTWVVGQSLLVSWFFQGMEKMKYITIYTLLARLLFVMLVFACIREKADNRFFILFMGIGSLIAGMLSILQAMRLFRLPVFRPNWRDILQELKHGWPVMVSNISINTFLSINVFILRLFTNDLVAGSYSVAEKIFLATRQIAVMFSQVIYPPLCQLLQKGESATRSFFRTVYLPFLMLVSGACVLLFGFSDYIISFFLGQHSGQAVLLLRLFCLGPVIVCLHIPASQLLMAADQKKSYLYVLTRGALINGLCNLALVPVWGATGTALSVLLTELFITVGFNRALYRNKLAGYLGASIR